MRGHLFAFGIAALWTALPPAAESWAKAPSLEYAAPCAAARGAQQRIKFVGSGLDSLLDVVFYTPGLRCLRIEQRGAFEAVAVIEADPDCPVGEAAFRLLTSAGFSNLKTMRICSAPIQDLSDRRDAAVPELGEATAAVFDVLEEGAGRRYARRCRAGQRLTACVEAVQLGFSLLDTVIKIYGPDGDLLVDADGSPVHALDPSASISIERDGLYTIEVHETNYGGGPEQFFLLFVGDFPPPQRMYPLGGPWSTELSAVPVANDDAALGEPCRVRIPSADANDQPRWWRYFPQGAPVGTPLRGGPLENVLEGEPHQSPDAAAQSPARPPIAWNGRLEQPGDADYFGLTAEPGRVYRLETFAARIGSPVDTQLEVLDATGRVLASNDDWGSHDSGLEFRAPSSGVVVVRIFDKLGGGRPDAVYRVEATAAGPALTPFLPRPDRTSSARQFVAVPQGNRALVQMAVRRDRFEGDAVVSTLDPPAGVSFPDVTVEADRYWAPVVIEAAEDAPVAGRLCRVVAAGESAGQRVSGEFRQVTDLVGGTADTLFHGLTVDRLAVAVTQPAPFRIELEPARAVLAAGGAVAVRVRVERDEGFGEAVRIGLPFLPPWVTCEPSVMATGEASETLVTLHADFRAAPRQWPLVAVAEIDPSSLKSEEAERWVGVQVASQLASLVVGPSPVRGDLGPLAGEQGTRLKAACALQWDGEPLDALTADVEGLPNRVRALRQEFIPGQQRVELEIDVPEDAPLGEFSGLRIRLNGERDGRPFSYVVSPDTRLHLAPPGKIGRDSEGRILSPLELLRRDYRNK